MENFDGEFQLRVEGKEEKPPLIPPDRKFKLKIKKADHSRSDGGENSFIALVPQINTTTNGNKTVYREELTCTVCKKRFRSPKSLCGHMRCHPEKDWKGMNPPANSSCRITTCPNYHDKDDGLLTRLLPWPAAGSRRRRTVDGGSGPAIVRAKSTMMDDEDEEELVKGAVYGLMLLATGDDRYRIVPSKEDDKIRVWEKNVIEAGSSSNKERRICGFDDDEGQIQMDKDHYKEEEKENRLEMVVYDMEAAANIGTSSGKKRKRKNETKELLMKSYTCSICSKCFSSPQALGGHTSSAHGNKMLIKNAGGQEQVVVVEDGVLGECPKDEELCGIMIGRGGGGGIHKCKMCGKEFSSGQALGGHMRLHWKAPPPQAADPLALSLAAPDSAGVVVEPQAQGEEQAVRKQVFMCFDLNEIPVDIDL